MKEITIATRHLPVVWRSLAAVRGQPEVRSADSTKLTRLVVSEPVAADPYCLAVGIGLVYLGLLMKYELLSFLPIHYLTRLWLWYLTGFGFGSRNGSDLYTRLMFTF